MTYRGSDAWKKDVADAAENWHRIYRDEAQDPHGNMVSVAIEAEAKTGSRYVVVCTALPRAAMLREGGPVLVTVLWPWQDAWTLQWEGDLHASYVAEHLTDGRWKADTLHGGDLAALTLTIADALGREAFVDG